MTLRDRIELWFQGKVAMARYRLAMKLWPKQVVDYGRFSFDGVRFPISKVWLEDGGIKVETTMNFSRPKNILEGRHDIRLYGSDDYFVWKIENDLIRPSLHVGMADTIVFTITLEPTEMLNERAEAEQR